MMEEDIIPDWSHFTTGDLLRARYEHGVRLRQGMPFSAYSYGAFTVAANRALDARCYA